MFWLSGSFLSLWRCRWVQMPSSNNAAGLTSWLTFLHLQRCWICKCECDADTSVINQTTRNRSVIITGMCYYSRLNTATSFITSGTHSGLLLLYCFHLKNVNYSKSFSMTLNHFYFNFAEWQPSFPSPKSKKIIMSSFICKSIKWINIKGTGESEQK